MFPIHEEETQLMISNFRRLKRDLEAMQLPVGE